MQLTALRKKAEGSAPPERKPGRRLTVRRGAALLLVLALAAGAALGGKALFFSGEEQTPLTEQTTYGSLSTTLSGTGTTMPADSVTYTTASETEITGVYVSAGDTVEVGELLYTQDDSELDDQIEEYQDQITEQENQLDDYQEQLAQLQEEIAALTVTAPFAGRITDVAVDVGDNVAAGTKLATLVDDSQMCLTQYFSYAYEDQVYVGMKAGVSVASLMLNQEGTVTDIQMVDRVTAEGTHCFAVTVTLDNPGAFTEGMTGAGYLVADSGEKLYPSVEGELEYRRSQDLTAEVGGEVTGIGAVDYEQVSAGGRPRPARRGRLPEAGGVGEQADHPDSGKDCPAPGEDRGGGGKALRLCGDRRAGGEDHHGQCPGRGEPPGGGADRSGALQPGLHDHHRQH